MFYCYRVAILTKSKYAVGAIAAVREKAARNCVDLSHNFQLSIAQLGAAIHVLVSNLCSEMKWFITIYVVWTTVRRPVASQSHPIKMWSDAAGVRMLPAG